MRGLFISVEGIDGAGKSTHIAFIEERLQNLGYKVIVTREPGGTPLGEKIRDILLHNDNEIHRITELCLMFASRQELISQVIQPNLDAGIFVIVDRFIDASIAYQGHGRNIGQDKLRKIISLLEPQLVTDLTLLFDVPLGLALDRVANKSKDRIEKESDAFFATVQEAYHQIAKNDPDRVKIIPTNQPIEATHLLLASHIDQLINQRGS